MPAPIVNCGGDRFWKWKEFKLSRARDLDLDLGSGHTAYRRASLIDPTYIPNFIEIEETFCGRTDGRTYGHFSPLILLGRLLEVDLMKPIRGKEIISTKLRPKSAYGCFCLVYCFLFFLFYCVFVLSHNPVARCSLFVLKVSLNTDQPTNQPTVPHWASSRPFRSLLWTGCCSSQFHRFSAGKSSTRYTTLPLLALTCKDDNWCYPMWEKV